VEFKSWRAREFWRLPDREKVADFLETIEADPNNPLVSSTLVAEAKERCAR
jgi:hypothetical protein